MKVLLVSEFFFSKPIGGVSRHIHDLASYLRKRGDTVHILTCRDYSGKDFLFDDVKIIKELLPIKQSFFNNISGIFASLDLTLALNRLGTSYDVVHIHSARIHFLNLLNISKPTLVTLHGLSPACICSSDRPAHCNPGIGARCVNCYVMNRKDIVKRSLSALISFPIVIYCMIHYKLMKKSMLNSSVKIICVSEHLKNELQRIMGVPSNKIMVIPNGVNSEDLPNFSQATIESFRENFLKPNQKLIFFIGNLIHRKGINVLIRTMPRIIKEIDAKLIIAGTGDLRSLLEKQVEFLGLEDRVIFVGYIDDKTKSLLFASADLAVVPSIYEPFGITALEAFSSKTPVIVSDSGGLSEIVETDKTGIKVLPNDTAALTDAMLSLLLDPDFSERLASKAFDEFCQKYTWEHVGKTLRNLYQQSIKLNLS